MKIYTWLTDHFNHKFVMLGVALLLLLGRSPALIEAQAGIILPPAFASTLITNTLVQPTSMTFAPDGRLFVTEKTGALRVIEDNVLLPTPFLTVSVNSAGERGLLGIDFDPDFVTNQFIYIYYTVPSSPPHNRVSRFTANGNVAVPNSELILLELNDLGATNHNGGAVHFGPDGKLYIGVGENANSANAQSKNNLLGKILRINSDGTIPSDNPFNSTTTGQNQAIWALGLRNPFTFAFQPVTGRIFINDVGQSTWEEINQGIAGSNYGWPTTEGPTSNSNFRSPLYAYGHSSACAIAGGVFYNPAIIQFPGDYIGDYFFADLCGNWIRRYDQSSHTAQDFATSTATQPVDLDIDSMGNLYYLARQGGGNNGALFRISYCTLPSASTPNAAPSRNYFTVSTPTLTWARVSYALGYEVRVDNTLDFGGPEYVNDQIPSDTLSITTDPLQDCQYYWHVRAKKADGKWGSWSATEVFTVNTH